MSDIKFFKPLYPLTGNGYFYGRVGSGKSYKLKAIVEYYYEKGFKIWDMFGGKRGEGPFWVFPSDELKLWKEYEKEVGLMKHFGPKEYDVMLVYPYFKDELPDQLPQKKPKISSQLMTIYFKDVTIKDISFVIGQVSPNAKYVWNYIVKTLPDNATGADILNLYNKKLKRYRDLNLFKNFIEPLVYHQILVGKNYKYNLNFKEIAKNKKEIFVLCDDYIPNEFKFFIMGYILRKLFYDYIMKDKVHKHNIAMFREMSLFMKVVDSSNQDDVRVQNFRNFISDIARYARSGLYIFGDTQSPAETRGLIEGQDDLLCISEMPSAKDREIVCEQLRKDRRISSRQIAYISTMQPCEMVIIERGKKAIKIKKVQPPKTKCWKQDDGNFLTIWKRIHNEFIDIRKDKNELEDLYAETNFVIENEYEVAGEKNNDISNTEKEIMEEEKEILGNNNKKNINNTKTKVIKSKKEIELERSRQLVEKYSKLNTEELL